MFHRPLATFCLLVFTILLFSCEPGAKGNGTVVTKTHDVGNFDAIDIGGIFEVILEEGNSPGVIVETDENLHELITVENNNGTLNIQTEGRISDARELLLRITFKKIKDIDLSGAVDLKSNSVMKGKNLEIDISGAADLTLPVDVKNLVIDASGGCEIDLEGTVNKIDFQVSGAGELKALNLEAKEAIISISGAGSAEVNVSKKLDVNVSGAGSVQYTGDPVISKSISGAGSVEKIKV